MGEMIVLFVLIDVLSCRIHWLGGLIVCVDGLLVGLMDSGSLFCRMQWIDSLFDGLHRMLHSKLDGRM